MSTLNAYSVVLTPTRIRAIVKNFPPVDSGCTSRKPTVATVVTVWYIASTNPKPNAT